jgi:hypothetical protein
VSTSVKCATFPVTMGSSFRRAIAATITSGTSIGRPRCLSAEQLVNHLLDEAKPLAPRERTNGSR